MTPENKTAPGFPRAVSSCLEVVTNDFTTISDTIAKGPRHGYCKAP